MSTTNTVDTNLIDKLTGKQEEGNKAVLAQLATLAEQLKTVTANQDKLAKENESLKAFQERTKRIINTPADKVDAGDLREVMRAVGIPDAEIDARLAGDEGDAGKEKADPRDTEIKALKEQVTSVATNVAQDRSKQLRTRFDAKITELVDGDKAFKKLYDAQVAAGKTKEATALRDAAIRLVERSAMRELNDAATTTKGVVDEAMIDSVVPKVSNDLTTLTSAIETTTFAGRSPDTGVSEYTARYTKKEPVKKPEFTGNEDIGTVETNLEAWSADVLGREIAAADNGAENKV